MSDILQYPTELENFADCPNFVKFEIFERQTATEFGQAFKTIFLAMPNEVKDQTKSNWAGAAAGQLGRLASNLAEPIAEKQSLGAEVVTGLNTIGQKAAAAGARILGNDLTAEQIQGITSGKIINPQISALFTSTDLRTFNFTFEFYPKQISDCDKIKEIIDAFKIAALPDQEDTFLKYPMEVSSIEFYSNQGGEQQVNKYFPRYGTCAIIDFSADYSIQTFRNGHPQKITLMLGFMELVAENRKTFKNGPQKRPGS